MRRLHALLLAFLALPCPVWSQDDACSDGRVSTYTASEGTLRGSFLPDAAIESRDVFTILRNGKPLGEAVVVKFSKGTCTLLPKGTLKGQPRMGDLLRFARHAEVPLDGTEAWKAFKAPEFSVTVPQPMTGPKQDSGSVESGSYTRQVWVAYDPSEASEYAVVVMRYELRKLDGERRWVELSLEESLKKSAAQRGSSVSWTRPVPGFGTGNALDFETVESDGMIVRGRTVLKDLTEYRAQVATKSSAVTSRSWKFLNSFKISPPQ